MNRTGWLKAAVLLAVLALPGGADAAEEPYDLYPDNIWATSELYETGYNYSPWNLVDQDVTTTWTEGVGGLGTGECIYYELPAGTEITEVSVWPGYYRSEELFYKNAAPSSLEISTGGNSYVLNTSSYAQTFQGGNVGCTFALTSPLICDGTVCIKILDVRGGSLYEDTCISELHLTGREHTGDEAWTSQGSQSTSSGFSTESGSGSSWQSSGSSGSHSSDPVYIAASLAEKGVMTGLAFRIYEAWNGSGQMTETSISAEDLTSQMKAYALFWLQYNGYDSRITEGLTSNEADLNDLRDIMEDLFGSATAEDMNTFTSEYIESRSGSRVTMSNTGDFGAAGPYYFDNAVNWGYDGEYLLITADGCVYSASSGSYEPYLPVAIYFSCNGSDTLGGWQLVEIIVGAEAEDAEMYFEGEYGDPLLAESGGGSPSGQSAGSSSQNAGSSSQNAGSSSQNAGSSSQNAGSSSQSTGGSQSGQSAGSSSQSTGGSQSGQSAGSSSQSTGGSSQSTGGSQSGSAGQSSASSAITDGLCDLALDYYERNYHYRPEYCDAEDNGDGSYTLHLYDIVHGHTATSAWYDVNANGIGRDVIMGGDINLNK